MNIEYLLKQLKMEEESSYFQQAKMEKPVYYKSSQKLCVYLKLEKPLPFQIWRMLKDRLMKHLKCSVEMEISVLNMSMEDGLLKEYADECIILNHLHLHNEIHEGKMKISEEQTEDFYVLQEWLKKAGLKLEEEKETAVLIEEVKKVKAPKVTYTPEAPKEKKSYVPRGKKTYLPLTLHEIHEACENVEIWGDIFEIEMRPVGKSMLQSVYLADDDDAIVMKRFSGARLSEEEMNQLKVGQRIRAYGRVVDDSYLRTLVFMPDRIEVIEKKMREDTAEKKRVELHLHTKLSEMDGVSDISQYIDQAAAWNHTALAITDHLVVQDFPKAQRYLEKINKGREHPIKMLYGVEMNMVDPELNIVTHPNDTKLEEASYCIFDLETTGLSSRYDHIIEFGGVIVENREVKDKLQMFIKPPVALSAFTTNLTNITEDDLANALPFEEAADKILEFIGDRVLVAHNASFDVNFINDSLIRIGRKPLENPVIDTLDLSYSMHADRKAHRLGNVARIYNIKYDEEVAHRADYDAQVLSDVYLNMLNELKDVKTLNELSHYYTEACFSKVRVKHIVVFAKNKAGLKSLFELITLSHTEAFGL